MDNLTLFDKTILLAISHALVGFACYMLGKLGERARLERIGMLDPFTDMEHTKLEPHDTSRFSSKVKPEA